MKTWDNYKDYVKSIDTQSKKEMEEIESQSAIISTIIRQRTELGISQRELAALCKIPQSSIARIESLKTTPRLDTLLKIMKQLGLNLSITTEKGLPK